MRGVGEQDRRGRRRAAWSSSRHNLASVVAAMLVAALVPACATQRPVLGEALPAVATTPVPTVAPAPAGLNPPPTPGLEVPAVTVGTVSDTVSGTVTDTLAGGDTTIATPAAVAAPDAVDQYRRTGWVAAENAKPGTDAWRITTDTASGQIEGYADTTSATKGDTVTLFVATPSPSWHAEAFRMGFYGGAGGRLIWSSDEQHTEWQRFTTPDAKTGLAEAGWNPSLSVPIDATWPPGAYLVKLTSSGNGAHYVPLTIRDDGSLPSMLVVNAVTTWQAYNEWGGCSAYKCPFVKGLARGTHVSFDRPYSHAYNKGAADFLDHERPLIAFAEELGLDLAYATSVDLDAHPEIVRRHKAVLTLGHDEYYSAAMRQALVDGRDAGVNLAFFGANAVYRQIRLEPSSDGRARRVLVNYRSSADPIAKTDPKLVTVEWHQLGHPAQELTGMAYQCADVSGDVALTNTANWVFAGAGVSDGTVLRSLAGNEIDGIVADRFTPPNLERLGRMRVKCGKNVVSGAMAYYSAASGAGVFASGTIWWVCGLDAEFCSVPANTPVVRAVTGNVLKAFAAGPAGTAHPSTASPTKG